jgi:hypothetical protein
LVDFLSDNKVEMNKGEGKYLFMRLDANRDGTITYPEYLIKAHKLALLNQFFLGKINVSDNWLH